MSEESERVVVAFQTGEVSPELAARADIERLGAACGAVQNMKLGVFGYAERRAGLEFIDFAKQSEPAAVVPTPTPTPTPSSLLTDLEEWWEMDEASGNRVGDVAATVLTDNNTVGNAGGNGGGTAALFVAANSEWLGAAAGFPNGDVSFTISLWVYMADSSVRSLVSKWNGTGNQREWWLQYRSDISNRFVWDVTPSGNGSGGTTLPASTFGTVPLNTWCLVTAWHDATANVTGIAVNDGAADTASHATGLFASSTGLHFGSVNEGASSFWEGRMQRAGYWSRVLTSDERVALYNSGAGVSYPF